MTLNQRQTPHQAGQVLTPYGGGQKIPRMMCTFLLMEMAMGKCGLMTVIMNILMSLSHIHRMAIR